MNAEIVGATGVTNDQLQNWMKRGLIIGQAHVEGGGKPGKHRTFSFFNLIEISIAKALLDVGHTDLKLISRSAAEFAHVGTSRPGRPRRLPGLPFGVPNSRTLFIVSPTRADAFLLQEGTSALAFYAAAMPGGSGATIIDASRVFDDVMTILGISAQLTLREEYESQPE
ncbi:MerR family transcriptional regulator [Paracoccus beibuensis]|uniref:hypothetical protein n=1 Tax=Paracoccus beibuensis TaxID=547602 RepID=UPI00223EDA9C|nr:hypothetical protein [Paracoccus beibuensis]